MVAAIARRVFLRPKIDEKCPDWARALIPFSEQEHGVGIPYEKIPQATLEALHFFFPVPVRPKGQREDMEGSARPKYARTCGMTVFLACLPYACAKQLELFSDANGSGVTGEVAVLSIRSLADLARKVGMSYDRLQRWMTVLVTLGFIWRFRDGKKTLYVIPLTVYAPRPSAETVRARMTALIHSQFVEIALADGQLARADRAPEYTDLLLDTRAKFEERYHLAPSSDLDLTDPSWDTTLSDVQQVLPGLTRDDLYAIIPIIARNLLQQSGTRKGRRFVLKGDATESTFSVETTPERSHTAGTRAAQKSARGTRRVRTVDALSAADTSACDSQEGAAHAQGLGAERLADKSRFDQQASPSTTGWHAPSQATSGLSDGLAASPSNLHVPSADSLTLGSPGLAEHPQAQHFEQEEKEAKERWCQQQGQEIARIFNDQKSLDFYIGVHRSTDDPLLLRALFIKVLYQEGHGGFRDSIGAYFNFMWNKVWGPFRTYTAACAKWKKWGKKREPQGIPPNIQQLVALYEHDSYAQIATNMGHWWPEAEQMERRGAPSDEEMPFRAMPLEEAEDLVEALRGNAGWYLEDPQFFQDAARSSGGYMVDALWPDGQVAEFATYGQWQELHRCMLTLPEGINAWFETERVEHRQDAACEGDDLSAQEREDCVQTALAMFAYYGMNATSLSWEELIILGIPLMGKRAESALEEAVPVEQDSIVVAEGQLYVRLDDGDLVQVDEYQRAFAACEEEEQQEEQASTVEGALAALQAELLLGLHVAVLHTCGLSQYRKLVANGEIQPECVATSETCAAAEETPAADGQGTDRQVAEALCKASIGLYLQRISNALDTRLYRVMWKLRGSGDGCAIEIESLLTGTVFTYESQGQVDELLAELRAQQGSEEAAVASYT